ncbi:MAG: ATP-dependent Clp protease proteolytic subunit [Solobacterium sp.]|nr:ATP-dependent Clp protease proteolytic subunit [Solobacterium sp.]
MYVEVKSSNGITVVPIETRLLSKRTIFIEDEIDALKASDFAKQVMYLNKIDPEKPINVMINSQGGEVNAGLFMYDVIQDSAAPVRMFCTGKAYSMAAVLFASGKHGRYMLPHAELMLHEPLLGNRVSGNSSSIKSISDSLLETKRMINRILAHHTGKSEKEVEKATSYDHYFTSAESIDFGLCDEIMSFGKMMEV